jgi:ligand-binding sensor domain-containing protein
MSFAQQPSHSIIGEEDLAGVNIYSIVQDNDNTIWLSTNNGLYHYDGITFTSIKSNIVNDQSLFGLDKDNNGRIYCYNLSGQILYIENKELKQYCQMPEKYISGVIYFTFDNKNNLIISSKSLLKYTKRKNEFKEIFHFESNNSEKLTKDKNNKIFFWSNDKKHTYFNDSLIVSSKIIDKINNTQNHAFVTSENQIIYFSNLYPKAILEEKSGNLLNVIYKVENDKTATYRPLLSKNHDLIWMANSKNGLYCFNLKGKPLFNNKLLFKDFFVSAYLEDGEGNFWLCTFGKGIVLIPNLNVIDYSNEDLIAKDDLNRITKKGKTLYFGGVKGNIYKLLEDKIDLKIEKSRKIESLKYLPKSDLFFVNERIFDGNLKDEKAINIFNKYDVFQNVNSDTIFYVTRSGLFCLDKNLSEKNLGYTTRTYSLFNDENNNVLWLASSTGLEIKRKGSFEKILVNEKPVFCSKIIKINNQIWTATTIGVLIFENEKLVRKIETNQGLLSNTVIKIIRDKEYVYISTNEGLQRYDLKTSTFRNFTKSDGLLSNAILDFEILDNQIYLITSKGIQRFSFNDLEENKKLPKIEIQKVLVNGFKQISNNYSLDSNENNVEFSFLYVTYKDKRNLKYEYQLEGFDEKWNTTNFINNSVKYTKLPAGKYVFKVRLRDSDTVSNEIRTFRFEVETVFWKKWQFIVAIVLASIVMFIIYYRNRINKLVQKKNEEIEKQKYIQELNQSKLKALKSQMNPHFMFNALNSIQEFILQNKKELASNYLGDFADLMRSYLQHSQEDTISLRDEIETLELYLKLEQIRFEEDFKFQIVYDRNLPIDAIEIPSFLLQPFVENAIKHGLLHRNGSKTVYVEFSKINEEVLECIIQDNGIGRKESERINKYRKHKSFATEASQNRLNLLNQNIASKIGLSIEDLYDDQNNPLGTKVIVTIPLLK